MAAIMPRLSVIGAAHGRDHASLKCVGAAHGRDQCQACWLDSTLYKT
jgi:hypothetical protein